MFEFIKKKKVEPAETSIVNETDEVKPSFEEPKQEVKRANDNLPGVELLIEKIESLKLQYEMLKEKIDNIESMIKEIYQIAKSE